VLVAEGLGARVKALRARHRLTQQQLGDTVGVSRQTIWNWENGAAQVPSADVPRLAAAFGVSVAELYEGDSPTRRERETFNVPGRIDDLRGVGVKPLPIYRWGSLGDPRDHLSAPNPDREDYPPPGREGLVGPNGFGVEVRGESMVARNVLDGDVVWVNPDKPYRLGGLVLALVDAGDGESGMVVKTYARTDVGECLVSERADGKSPVVCREYKIIGPIVWIQRGFPPQ